MALAERLRTLFSADIAKPMVHMNGTDKKGLIRGYLDAHEAVQNAISVLQANSPNGRDYYPQGYPVFRQAINEHKARIKKLQDVADELYSLAEHVHEQKGGRE